MKFSINEFFSKSDQIQSFLRIWSHLLKKPLMENFIFCAENFAPEITTYGLFSRSSVLIFTTIRSSLMEIQQVGALDTVYSSRITSL